MKRRLPGLVLLGALGAALPASAAPSVLLALVKQVRQNPEALLKLSAQVASVELRKEEAKACSEAFAWALQDGERKLGLKRGHLLAAMKGLWFSDREAFLARMGGKDVQHSALAADALEEMGADPEGKEAAWARGEGLRIGEPRVRAQCASYLGRIRARAAAPRVAELLESDPDEEVREMCARALSRIGGDPEVPRLQKAAQEDPQKRVRKAAALALAWIGTRAAGDALMAGKDPPAEALRILTGAEGRREAEERWGKTPYIVGADTTRPGGTPESVDYGKKGKRPCEQARILYVFDCSGSIPNHKGQQKAYGERLSKIQDGVRFDAVAFAVGVYPWQGRLVEADFRSRRAAQEWIERFDGRSGTTPLSAAIRKALTEYDVDEVVLFTDGGGNTGVAGKYLFDYVQTVNVCRRVRLRGVPVGNLENQCAGGGTFGEALLRLVVESGGTAEGNLEKMPPAPPPPAAP